MRRDAAEAKVQWDHDKVLLLQQVEAATNRASRLQKQLSELASSKQQQIQQEQHYQQYYVRGGNATTSGVSTLASSSSIETVHKDMLSLRRLSEDSMKQTQQLLDSVHKLNSGDSSDIPLSSGLSSTLSTSLPPMKPRASSISSIS